MFIDISEKSRWITGTQIHVGIDLIDLPFNVYPSMVDYISHDFK
jgi:hypothetical protein